jgi:hypothetical protein
VVFLVVGGPAFVVNWGAEHGTDYLAAAAAVGGLTMIWRKPVAQRT